MFKCPNHKVCKGHLEKRLKDDDYYYRYCSKDNCKDNHCEYVIIEEVNTGTFELWKRDNIIIIKNNYTFKQALKYFTKYLQMKAFL
jgi:hypothetical protein